MKALGVVTEPRTVRLERVFPGPIERVWAYLTDSEKRGKWLAPGEMELRVGGRVSLVFNNDNLSADKDRPERFKNPGCPTIEGRVTRYEPPRLLAFTWGEGFGEVTFELTPKNGEVLFVVTHRGLPTRDGMVLVSSGWDAHTGVLGDILGEKEPRPFWKTFLGLEQEYEKRIAR
jgi:uncharacterized protein YndB with AHSA1/START domain